MVSTSGLPAAAAHRELTGLVRTDGRPSETAGFEAEIVAFFVDAADLLGVPKSVAALYGICFAVSEPLSFADIEQKLDLSKGSISQGLRFLREVGALKEVSTDADRVERFEPELEMRKLAVHWIEERLQKQLNAGRTRLQAIGKAVPSGKNGSAKVLKARLKSLQNWHDRTRAVLPLVKTFLKLG